DHQRALVWIDGRFDRFLTPGLYAWWTGLKDVRVEVIDARKPRFEHGELKLTDYWPMAATVLDICKVERNRAGVLFVDGRYVGTLSPGYYAFWKGEADAKVVEVDLREQLLDVAGQDIMTADKVTLRLNAVVTYTIVDAHRAVSASESASQALYREVQLALRAVIGGRELDAFLSDKDDIVRELEELVRARAEALGLKVDSLGIRDVILPGDMKDLMNRVTEAKKAAEANLISRREETAAMRSQANTAKLLENNPSLMRLKELEVLEKIAASGHLNIILGEQGLADRVMKLL
ncbi:MAG: slipin family protein, partial [Planctomycetes bacterium]|nr:slipin family protein [Planctomycetota bacterium]